MRIYKVECNNTRFEFICESRSTRHGFAHDCNLFINDSREQTAHCYYLNRTWECWQYQTVCLSAINAELEWYSNRTLEAWKRENEYNRMTKARRILFDQYLKELPYFKTLTACKEQLTGYKMIGG